MTCIRSEHYSGKASAAAEVHHHRSLAGKTRRPDIQLEHILAHIAVIPVEKK